MNKKPIQCKCGTLMMGPEDSVSVKEIYENDLYQGLRTSFVVERVKAIAEGRGYDLALVMVYPVAKAIDLLVEGITREDAVSFYDEIFSQLGPGLVSQG